MSTKLSFYGAAGNVTGSCYLLEIDKQRILVDCGMYQERDYRTRNWDPFPFTPADVDAVLLTHAHVDHCGLLPKLVRDGFRGRIYCTPATVDIARIILLDSARIQEEDVKHKRRRHKRAGRTSPFEYEPIYTVADAEATLSHFSENEFGETLTLGDIEIDFHVAGHILGSASITLRIPNGKKSRTLLFSGDIGRWETPILKNPTEFEDADYVVMESTYGNRSHEAQESVPGAIADVINQTCEAGGNVIIPSFAVERTQEVLYHLSGLLEQGRIPHLVTFVDSPMATRVTEVFRRHLHYFDKDAQELLERGVHPCDFPDLHLCRTVAQSKAIKHIKNSCIIIAGSGMCTGGRVKHHLASNISRPESTVLFVGYQAVGTLGRIILEGAEKIRLFGEKHTVRARVEKINGFSGHADREELHRWIDALDRSPRQVFITHGEPDSSRALSERISRELKCPATAPAYKDSAVLE
jgi:metallo-beta-lactamase family protein